MKFSHFVENPKDKENTINISASRIIDAEQPQQAADKKNDEQFCNQKGHNSVAVLSMDRQKIYLCFIFSDASPSILSEI